MRWDAAFAKTGHCACCANGKPSSCSARGGNGNSPGAPTFTDVLILQPELPLDLPVGVPDGARLLKAIHGLLDVVVAKLVQQCHKVPAGGGPIQRVQCIAEGWGENMRGCSNLCRCSNPWGCSALGSSTHAMCTQHPSSHHPACGASITASSPHMLTLGDGQLVEPDVVHDRLHLPVL